MNFLNNSPTFNEILENYNKIKDDLKILMKRLEEREKETLLKNLMLMVNYIENYRKIASYIEEELNYVKSINRLK